MMYRVFTGPDGVTHGEEIDLLPAPRKSYDEVARLGSASSRKALKVGFQSQAPGFFADWHATPYPLYTVQLSGHAEYGLGDGRVLKLGPGDVTLLEDTSGMGHTTRVLGDAPRAYLSVQLEEAPVTVTPPETIRVQPASPIAARVAERVTQYEVISCDDHMDLNYIPPDVWQKRLPERWKAAGPRVLQMGDTRVWSWEGQGRGISGSRQAKGGKEPFSKAGIPEQPEPGVWRPSSPGYRLADMDHDGAYAQVIYGTPSTFDFKDRVLKLACFEAYNSWLAEEFCAAGPERLIGLAMLPTDDPPTAVGELRRVAKLGLKGVIIDVFGGSRPPFDPIWDPLWSAAEETGTVVSFHLGGGMHSLRIDRGSWRLPASMSVAPMQLDEAVAGMVFCGALERHPKLQLVMGESGLGWVPYLIERMDFEFKKYYDTVRDVRLNTLPSVLFRRQIHVTFEEDDLGVKFIPLIGAGNVMWASDYPHGDSTFPNSREAVERIFKEAGPEIKTKVVWDNVAALYGIKAPTIGPRRRPGGT